MRQVLLAVAFWICVADGGRLQGSAQVQRKRLGEAWSASLSENAQPKRIAPSRPFQIMASLMHAAKPLAGFARIGGSALRRAEKRRPQRQFGMVLSDEQTHSRRQALAAFGAALALSAQPAFAKFNTDGFETMDAKRQRIQKEKEDFEINKKWQGIRFRALQTKQFDKYAETNDWTDFQDYGEAWEKGVRVELIDKVVDALEGDDKSKGQECNKRIKKAIKKLRKIQPPSFRDKAGLAAAKKTTADASEELRVAMEDLLALEPARLLKMYGYGMVENI